MFSHNIIVDSKVSIAKFRVWCVSVENIHGAIAGLEIAGAYVFDRNSVLLGIVLRNLVRVKIRAVMNLHIGPLLAVFVLLL
jgi:hypothetical protein